MSYARQLLDTYPRDFNLDAQVLAATIDALLDCAQACTACADDCLSERRCLAGQVHPAVPDGADVCTATLRVPADLVRVQPARRSCWFDSSGVAVQVVRPWIPVHPGRQVGHLASTVAMIGPRFPVVLKAAAGGDGGAFGMLWCDLQPRLLRYLRVAAGGAGEDLASETWLGVVRGIGRFQGNEPAFRAWVFTIARHQVLDWRRRAARTPTQDLPVVGLAEPAASDDPAAAAVEGASTRAALALIATLPADQAEAIALRVVAGLEVSRVAEVMGKRPGTVRVLAHRGLRRLAERLGADARVGRVG